MRLIQNLILGMKLIKAEMSISNEKKNTLQTLKLINILIISNFMYLLLNQPEVGTVYHIYCIYISFASSAFQMFHGK